MKGVCVLLLLMLASSISFADGAQTITAVAGSDFTITLESNKSTGYEWQIAKPYDEKLINLKRAYYVPSKSGHLRAAGKEEWKFRALKRGETTLTFKYAMPGGKTTPSDKEASFRIVVND